jgi:hypothetical protein
MTPRQGGEGAGTAVADPPPVDPDDNDILF